MKIVDGLEHHPVMGGDDDTDEEDEDTPFTNVPISPLDGKNIL